MDLAQLTWSAGEMSGTRQFRLAIGRSGPRFTLPILTYLGFLVLAGIIPLVILAFIVNDRFAATQNEHARELLFSNARVLAEAVDQEVDKHIAIATVLSRSPALLA